eukprot:8771927-Heterocapsa_arctica.AAC.1
MVGPLCLPPRSRGPKGLSICLSERGARELGIAGAWERESAGARERLPGHSGRSVKRGWPHKVRLPLATSSRSTRP